MGPEAKLYQKLRKNSKGIVWTRLENISSLGTPDLLGYNNSGTFFTVELKVTRGNKLKFSAHQIAWHVQHPKNSFILAEALGPRSVKLFRGSRIRELAACGLKLRAYASGLAACRLKLQKLGAWGLQLAALVLLILLTIEVWGSFLFWPLVFTVWYMLNWFCPACSTRTTFATLCRCRAARASCHHARCMSPGRGSWPVDLGAG